jgi:hypothetical protein
MLNETKKDLTLLARRLVKPYEVYSIDELADAYCDAVDNHDETLKSVYISALILRFWYTIDKMYSANKVAPSLEHEDFFWWLYEAIEYACKYRGWRDTTKNLNARQCINKCIDTIKLQKYYELRLDKHKVVNCCVSLETPIKENKEGKTWSIIDTAESDDNVEDIYADDATIYLIQSYIDCNKVIEAILLDNIITNDVQKHYKKVIKIPTEDKKPKRYTEYSSEFWPYKLIQIVSALPNTYKASFMNRYDISEEKLTTVLDAIDKTSNQKLYKYLRATLANLRETYTI